MTTETPAAETLSALEQLQALRELEDNIAGNVRIDRKIKAATRKHKESQSPVATKLRDESVTYLTPVVQAFITSKPKQGSVPVAKRHLMQLEAESSAYLICCVMLNELSYEVGEAELCGKLADAILNELRWRKLEELEPKRVKQSRDKFKLLQTEDVRYMLNSLKGTNRSVDLQEFNDPDDRLLLGYGCLGLFQQANPGMFESRTEIISDGRDKVKSPSIIFATPETKQRLAEQYDWMQDRDPILSPSLIKPVRWTNPGDGAYGFSQEKYLQLIKKRNGRSLGYLANAHMPTVYAALNALQETTWRVNLRVHKVVCQIEEAGGNAELLGIIRKDPIFNTHTKTPLDVAKPAILGPDDNDHDAAQRSPEELKAWKHLKNVERAKNREWKEQHKEYERTMKVVDDQLDAKEFFFPHNLDFRGRAYPIPVYYTLQGRDLEKGLLEFAEGKPLGSDEAWRWFILHGVNLLEKNPFPGGKSSTKLAKCLDWAAQGLSPRRKLTKLPVLYRYNWIDDHREHICAVAEDPIQNNWWMISDSPLCFLAWCFEYAEWSHLEDQGRGLEFVSHLPIALDGSCNGLQHFSCLLRDERLAERVNLMPSADITDLSSDPTLSVADYEENEHSDGDYPEDYYDEVASAARETLKEMMAANVDGDGLLASDLLKWNRVDRKFLKRNIMALPYGSVEQGFKTQYLDFMKHPDNKAAKASLLDIIEERTGDRKYAAHFKLLANVVWKIIGDKDTNAVARHAVEAMVWFKQLVNIANEATDQPKPIRWTVPSGFVVEMDYRVTRERQPKLRSQQGTYRPVVIGETAKISKAKQLSTISANIIHSLDASHMMLTVTKLLSSSHVQHFAMVHDSFATHAADTSLLCRAIKEQLSQMYLRNDILASLENGILENAYAENVQHLPARPAVGTLDLTQLPTRANFSFI